MLQRLTWLSTAFHLRTVALASTYGSAPLSPAMSFSFAGSDALLPQTFAMVVAGYLPAVSAGGRVPVVVRAPSAAHTVPPSRMLAVAELLAMGYDGERENRLVLQHTGRVRALTTYVSACLAMIILE